jgi:hypothetical protein
MNVEGGFMTKILFICTEGFDTPGPHNHLHSAMIEDFLEQGFSVALIQSRRQRINDELPDVLMQKENLEVTDNDLEELAKKDAVKTGLPVEQHIISEFLKGGKKFKILMKFLFNLVQRQYSQ